MPDDGGPVGANVDQLRQLVDEMDDDREDIAGQLAELLEADRVRLAEVEPRLVPVSNPIITDADGTRRYVGPLTCPDCGRGFHSIDGVMLCAAVPDSAGKLGGKPGDIVACGRN
jgi:hypothetical protein